MMVRKREIIVVILLFLVSAAISIPSYLYAVRDSKPGHVNDGWKVSFPEQQGMDPVLLSAAERYLGKTDATSLIVVRNGCIVMEKYYRGQRPRDFSFAFASANTFMSALIGIAVREGQIKSVNQKIVEFFPEYFIEGVNQDAGKVTVEQLLTMTSGFAVPPEELFRSMKWIRSLLSVPLEYSPGSTFRYSPRTTHLLSGILTKATGMSAYEYAKKYLLEPLGINSAVWHTGPEKYNIGGSYFYMKPQDMARFATLYANDGVWNGRRVISEEWIQESLEKHVELHSARDCMSGKECEGFGYCFILEQDGGYMTCFGDGEGDTPNICVIPGLDTAVVITAYPGMFKRAVTYEDFKNIIHEYIIPSVRG